MKKNGISFVIFLMFMMSLLFFLTGCQEERRQQSAERLSDKQDSIEETTTITPDTKKDFDPKKGFWELEQVFIDHTEATIDRSDDIQSVLYSYSCEDYLHTMTLNYSPLENDRGEKSRIPEYTQKCICKCNSMPKKIFAGKSYDIELEGNYAEKNEYAGICVLFWASSNDERVKIKCNEGYAKEDVYAGEGTKGLHDTMKATFKLTAPKDDIEKSEKFIVYFESSCGATAYRYKWVNE